MLEPVKKPQARRNSDLSLWHSKVDMIMVLLQENEFIKEIQNSSSPYAWAGWFINKLSFNRYLSALKVLKFVWVCAFTHKLLSIESETVAG